MRALITGAAGLLGTALVPDLDAAWECWPVGHRQRPTHARGRTVELEDADSVRKLIGDVKPNVVVHLAALADVDACERDPERAWRSNVGITRNIVDACAAIGNPVVVYVSTDQLYDGPGANAEDAIRPRNVYALTKLWGEDVALQRNRAIVLRLNFIGLPVAGRPGFAGWLIESLQAQRPIRVFHDVHFNPIYAGFLAPIVRNLVESGACGVFNVGGGGAGMSKATFARRLAARFGFSDQRMTDASAGDSTLAAYRPRGMVMDVGRLTAALRRAPPTVEDSLAALHSAWRATGVAA